MLNEGARQGRRGRAGPSGLLFYYCGHGMDAGGRLYLSMVETIDNEVSRDAPDSHWAKCSIPSARPRSNAGLVLILDCCFAGLACGERAREACTCSWPSAGASWLRTSQRHWPHALYRRAGRLDAQGRSGAGPWIDLETAYRWLEPQLVTRYGKDGLPFSTRPVRAARSSSAGTQRTPGRARGLQSDEKGNNGKWQEAASDAPDAGKILSQERDSARAADALSHSMRRHRRSPCCRRPGQQGFRRQRPTRGRIPHLKLPPASSESSFAVPAHASARQAARNRSSCHTATAHSTVGNARRAHCSRRSIGYNRCFDRHKTWTGPQEGRTGRAAFSRNIGCTSRCTAPDRVRR